MSGVRPRTWPEQPWTSGLFDDAAAPELQRAEREDHHEHDHAAADQAVVADRVGRGMARVVRDEGHRCRPCDPAERVPHEEPPPRHVRDPGGPRAGEAEAAEPAREEDRLAAVPAKEPLRRWKDAVAEAAHRAVPLQKAAAE